MEDLPLEEDKRVQGLVDEIVQASLVPRPKRRLASFEQSRAWDWGPYFEKDEDTQDFQTRLKSQTFAGAGEG